MESRVLISLVALVGLVLSPALATTAHAASTSAAVTASSAQPQILPTPQEVGPGSSVRLDGRVTIVVGADTDRPAIKALREVLDSIGARVVDVRVTSSSADSRHVPSRTTVIYLGTPEDNAAIPGALRALGLSDSEALTKTEGYVLKAGRVHDSDALVLAGHDGAGTFYAVQTLRQIVPGGRLADVTVQDWPLMAIRGAIEGFYGIPWSHQARLDMMAFYGQHKMNTHIYSPRMDPLLRTEWRTPFTAKDLASIRDLAQAAEANHVNFTFALSPAGDICYSSQADYDALIAKFDQVRALGVTSFYIALDAADLDYNCDADADAYPDDGDARWLARAQADLLNRVQRDWIVPNDLKPLQMVPTLYSGSEEKPYKTLLGELLDEAVRVQWTGEGVFSDTITEESVARAAQTYGTDHLYIWDNFPVNDLQRGRLFLNPLTGRDADLYQHIEGFTSNPMIQPYASMPALANFGDYTWNGPGYDANESMDAVLKELAGSKRGALDALVTFADLNQAWVYRPDTDRAPMLSADIDAFWTAYLDGSNRGTRALKQRLDDIVGLPRAMQRLAQPGFTTDAQPWIDAAGQWAHALQEEIAMLDAVDRDRGEAATQHMLAALEWIEKAKQPTVDDLPASGELEEDAIVPAVGDGAFQAFSARALKVYSRWLGADPANVRTYQATADSSMGARADFPVTNMVDGALWTRYSSLQPGTAGEWVRVDLGQVREVGSVRVNQGISDTDAGNVIRDAALEYSTDGRTWTEAGTFTDATLVHQDFPSPVQARYLRLRAVTDNPGGERVAIREFQVSPTPVGISSNLDSVTGAGPEQAFDGDAASAFQATQTPRTGSSLTRELDLPIRADRVVVAGLAVGEIQVRTGGAWTTVGQLRRGSSHTEARLRRGTGDAVTGVRLLFTAGSVPPSIHEVVLRTDS